MEVSPDLKFLEIHNNIKQHFNFLFGRGFHIVSAIFVDNRTGNWQVLMEAGTSLINIYCRQGKIQLALSALHLYDDLGFLDLYGMVQLVESECKDLHVPEEHPMDERQQFEKLASQLKRHIDGIFTFLEKSNPIPPKWSQSVPQSIETGDCPSDNRPFLIHQTPDFIYSLTSPSITSPSFDGGGVDGPPGASG